MLPHLSGSSSSNKSSSRSKLILPDIFLAANRFLALSSGVLLGPRQSSGLGLVLLPRGRPRPLLRPSPASLASCSASLSDRAYMHTKLVRIINVTLDMQQSRCCLIACGTACIVPLQQTHAQRSCEVATSFLGSPVSMSFETQPPRGNRLAEVPHCSVHQP